jgi:hypothetical protein
MKCEDFTMDFVRRFRLGSWIAQSQRKTNPMATGSSTEESEQHFSPIFFIFFLPSFTFICLQQPSFAFIGEGSERGFGGVFRRPARAAWAGWSRQRVAGGEMDCAYVSHT